MYIRNIHIFVIQYYMLIMISYIHQNKVDKVKPIQRSTSTYIE